ncbi:MAG: hypothetical protein HKN47_22245 [Pirellulaceae bacterium]|nr:hypothetical protein [Pirellulaceae bacterium]
MRGCIYIVIGLLMFPAAAASANNNLLLPGDAFFPTVLTQQKLTQLAATKPEDRTFEYSSLGGYEMAFCGYAGYANVRFRQLDQAFTANLQTAYDSVRSWQPREIREEKAEGKTKLVETNGVRVLFYRSDFPFPGGKLGLRYNESWVAEALRFGHQRDHLRLCCLINHPEAVMQSWRDADQFAGLTFDPTRAAPKPGQSIAEPVVVTDDIKAIVIASYELKELFQSDQGFFRLYVVDSEGVKELHFDGQRWGAPDPESPF